MALPTRYLKNSFLRGSLLFTIASFSASFLNYLFNVIVAKKLGPAGFGEITALFSYSTIFSVPIIVLTMVLVQKIGAKKSNNLSYALSLEQWFLSKLRTWWLLLIPFLFATPLIQSATNLSFYSSVAMAPLVMLSFLGAYYGALLQGLHFFGWLSILGLIAVVLKLMGAIAIADSGNGIFLIIIFLLISSAAVVVAPFALLRRFSANASSKVTVLHKRLLHSLFQKQVATTLFSVLGLTLLSNVDIVVAKKFLSPDQAGIYGAWSLFGKIILYVMGPLITASYIFFSNQKTKQSHEKVLRLSLVLLIFIGVTSFLFYTFAPDLLINLLVGKKFTSIAPVLGFASVFGFLYTSTTFINNYFLSKKSILSLFPLIIAILYVPTLIIAGRSIAYLILINISAGTMLLLLQIVGLVKYNTGNGKQKK